MLNTCKNEILREITSRNISSSILTPNASQNMTSSSLPIYTNNYESMEDPLAELEGNYSHFNEHMDIEE